MVAFGTSGLRGLATDLLAGPAVRHTAAFAAHLLRSALLQPGQTVLLGRDRRDSSPLLLSRCASALRSQTLEPVDCGILPTPALALHAMRTGAACVMVTGSHIPADRNGLKFYRPDGEIDKADEAAIVALAAGRTIPDAADGDAASDGGVALASYVERYRATFAPTSLAGLRIGIYEHSSVARDLLADLLSALGAEIVRLGRSATFVPIDTEAIDPALEGRFAEWTAAHGLDAIVSTDGDADRPLVADETGAQIRGDVLGLLTARRLAVRTVATPVTSNAGLEAALEAAVVRTRVGSPFVLAAMADSAHRRPVAGFEANGGFILGSPATIDGMPLDALPTRDSLLPILATLDERNRDGRPLSSLVGSLGLPRGVSGRLEHVAPERSAAFMAWLRAKPAHVPALLAGLGVVVRVADVDGVQAFLEGGGMLHYRPSGNAPEMRCYAQAPSAAGAAELLAGGLQRLRRFLAEGPEAFAG